MAEVIIIKESTRQSLISDAGTFALFIGLIGIGWALDSAAMQWTGAVVGFITVLGQSQKPWRRMTIADARKKLDELEAQQQ